MSDNKDQPPIVESFTKLKEMMNKAKKFWRTKQAIDQGIPLYAWPSTQISDSEYYGPWKFNAIETAFTGGIAATITNFVGFITGVYAEKPKIQFEGASPELAEMLEKTSGWLTPFIVPILTTSIVFIIAWGSLKSKDSNPSSRKQARSAYLYFDGAFAFYPQLILAGSSSVVISLLPSVIEGTAFNGKTLFCLIVFIIAAIAFLIQIYVSLNKIPKHLFQANGYTGKLRHFWQKTLDDSPPSNKFALANYVGGWPLLAAVTISLSLLARGLAYLLVWFKGIFA